MRPARAGAGTVPGSFRAETRAPAAGAPERRGAGRLSALRGPGPGRWGAGRAGAGVGVHVRFWEGAGSPVAGPKVPGEGYFPAPPWGGARAGLAGEPGPPGPERRRARLPGCTRGASFPPDPVPCPPRPSTLRPSSPPRHPFRARCPSPGGGP